jgi:hypothetical protein
MASVRLSTRGFAKMLRRCVFTVASDMARRVATSLLDMTSAWWTDATQLVRRQVGGTA